MTQDFKNRLAALEKQNAVLVQEVADLKALLRQEVARLDKVDDADNDAVTRFIERHADEHIELYRKISASYARTHPEWGDTMRQINKVLGVDTHRKP